MCATNVCHLFRGRFGGIFRTRRRDTGFFFVLFIFRMFIRAERQREDKKIVSKKMLVTKEKPFAVFVFIIHIVKRVHSDNE